MKRFIFLLIVLFSCSTLIWAQNVTDDSVYVQVEAGKLGGKLMKPNGFKKGAVAIIIQGSGPTDKDGNSMILGGKNNSLKMLAQSLADVGIASLRFDKRGMGLSTDASTNEADLVFDDFINDATAWLDLLQKQKRFKRFIVIGHSQGSLIGMRLANERKVDAFISLAGPSLTIDETLKEQLRSNPMNPESILKEAEDIMAKIKSGEKVESVPPYFQSLFRESIQPFMCSWMKYNPLEEINTLDIPVLVVNGSTDLQVSVEDAQRLQISNEKSELLIVEGMNHVLKESSANQAENVATYKNPELPLHPKFEQGFISFMKKHILK